MTVSIKLLFILGLLLILGLRFADFGNNPISLNRDEAAIGYNAWTLAHFGVDEWGSSWPLNFKSFGDYKLPGYIYFTSALFKIMPTNSLTLRLPSALAGLGIVVMAYLISKTYFGKKAGIWAGFIAGVAPWTIFYSRMAYEANLGLFLLLLVIYFCRLRLSFATIIIIGVSYIFSVLTYNTPLLLIPVILGYVWLAPQKAMNRKVVVSATLIFIALAMFWASRPIIAQKKNITLFNDPTVSAQQRNAFVEADSLFERYYNHRLIYYPRLVIERYVKTFSPEFLVVSGGAHPWHSLPGRGHFHLTAYVLAFIGLVMALRKKSFHTIRSLIWLTLLSPLPAIITIDAPHATRSLLTFFLLLLWAGYGLSELSHLLKGTALTFIVLETGIFAIAYFGQYPTNMPKSWPHGIEAALDKAYEEKESDRHIVVVPAVDVNDSPIDAQIYIYVLWHRLITPQAFAQTRIVTPDDAAGQVQVAKVDRVIIKNDRMNMPNGAVVIELHEDGRYEIKD